jgi:carbon storage regulator
MLVLSRKVGEQIVIGDNITVVVNKVTGNRISLGISAPSDVRIVRGELKEAVSAFEGDDADAEPLPLVSVPTFHLVSDAVVHRAR